MKFFLPLSVFVLVLTGYVRAADDPAEGIRAATKVHAIFEAKCLDCHGPNSGNTKFAFGGTIYKTSAATDPVGAGVEVRVAAAGGTSVSVYTDANGMTLYTFDKDEKGKSNCYDKCAANWPPLKAEAGAKAVDEWSVVDRTDGTKMWAYDGKPVYTFVKDKKAGDTTGEGVAGAWHVVKAD